MCLLEKLLKRNNLKVTKVKDYKKNYDTYKVYY